MPDDEKHLEYWNRGGPRVYTEDDLNAAIGLGIITREGAVGLKELVLSGRSEPLADEENFRLISGFNDIFVVIASIMLLTAVGWLLERPAPALAALTISAIAWGLSEYFVKQKRLALTAIVLLAAFAGGAFAAVGVFIENVFDPSAPYIFAPAFLFSAGLTWLHWRRFRVPVTVAVGSAGVVGLTISLMGMAWPDLFDSPLLAPIILAAGLAVLALAIKWDSGDPFRRTRRADVAFWLHLLAAPLLVHPIFHIIGVFDGSIHFTKVLIILGTYIFLALVSLTLDRRALMVSSLIYVLYAFGSLFNSRHNLAEGFALSALLIGASLLLLAAFWRTARGLLLSALPEGLLDFVPPAEGNL